MTIKKNIICEKALELFAQEGYDAVATNRIAKAAGVSEGLIFRHFGNKQGLLDAIIAEAEVKIAQVMGPVLMATKPSEVIQKFIETPFNIDPNQYNFWRLFFKIKWDARYTDRDLMSPVMEKLTHAFEQLNYSNSRLEAMTLNHLIYAISIAILREGLADQLPLKPFLLNKYNID